jgi:hypothetical protein
MELSKRDLATVLCALRLFQRYGERQCSEHFAGIEPLSNEEIDELCERLNCG